MNNKTTDPSEALGLVICDITARDDLFSPRFVSPDEVEQAKDAIAAQSRPEMDDAFIRYSVSLSPASVRVSHRFPGAVGKPANYKAKSAIGGWSRKSRAAMVARLCSLDYSEMLADPARPPAMITLTYPSDWEAVVPDGNTAKRHLRAFQKRYQRSFGESLRAIWKMEFQRRGAVHFHLFCVPPRGVKFRSWLSENWTDIVSPPDPDERIKHQKAGTGLDYETGLRSYDAKRVAVYFSKHGSANYGDKEYQNTPPDEWIAAGSVGRFWGYWHLCPSISTVEICEDDALFVSRVLRRWARANSKARRVVVWRTNQRTGEIYKRAVRRRPRRLTGRSGFVAVNDGSAMGRSLARALTARLR